MFDTIAPRYDLINRLMTFGLDQAWRRGTVAALALPEGSLVLDLACGTGDLLIALERAAGRRLIGSDFCHPMLTGAQTKLRHGRLHSVLIESDALALPFRDASLDLITIAAVDETEGGVQVTYDLVMEVKDTPKPACVAQVVYRYYR